ncbi:MAG TPA: hypothetical protein VJV78_08075 [Polyangiales bacterium]|nr:hypothetical protein [Polyangiales bacterium]
MQNRASTAAGASRLAQVTHRIVQLGTVALICAASTLDAASARAQQVEVTLTIQTLGWSDCTDLADPPDIYHRVFIDGVQHVSPPSTSNFSFDTGLDIQFSQSVDFSKGTIPIQVIQQDDDDQPWPFDNDDDTCKISTNGSTLELQLNMATCVISGEANGNCGATITIEDNSIDMHFAFKVEVQEPAAAPGLNVRCIHDPIWPQPGDTVTISAESLDGALAPRIANAVEIWVTSRAAPAISTPGTMANFVIPAAAGDSFQYGCRVVQGANVAWTGWRTVAVGAPPALVDGFDGRIPVMFTGPRPSSLDFVFYHDHASYPAHTAPAFLNDVRSVIHDTFQTDEIFLKNQHAMNFWIAPNGGNADDGCEMDVSGEAAWEDNRTVLHTDNIRDCSLRDDRVATGNANAPLTIKHEVGHVPFGLADEYCCDGGYFQTPLFSNLYFERDQDSTIFPGCIQDAVKVGRAENACRAFEETVDWWFDTEWWTSDPGDTTPGFNNDDLMNDNGPRQILDTRQMDFVFGACTSAGC